MGLLSQFNDQFNTTKPAEKSGGSVPDGKYQARIDRVEVKESKTGKPMIAYQLVVVAGPQANRRVFKNSVVSDNSMPYLKAELAIAGFAGSLDALDTEAGRASLLDKVLEIQVKTKGDSNNCYFNRLVGTSPAAAAHDADGNPPF